MGDATRKGSKCIWNMASNSDQGSCVAEDLPGSILHTSFNGSANESVTSFGTHSEPPYNIKDQKDADSRYVSKAAKNSSYLSNDHHDGIPETSAALGRWGMAHPC